jgi:hypothetical protein
MLHARAVGKIDSMLLVVICLDCSAEVIYSDD